MRNKDKISEYTARVCEQIRWKKARLLVSDELTNHISDCRDTYIAQGLDSEEAVDKAIEDTGDAELIGSQLDRIHRPKPQWGMLGATTALILFGLLVRLFVYNGNGAGLLSNRLIFTGIGLAGMLVFYFADFTFLGMYSKGVLIFVAVLSILTIWFSPMVNGRHYHAQYVILLFPLVFAVVIYTARNQGVFGIVKCLLLFVSFGIFAFTARYISGFMHFAFAGFALLAAAILKNWFGTKKSVGLILAFSPVAILAIMVLMNLNAYRGNRLAIAFNPSLDPYNAGYFGVMGRKLLSGAKLFGAGHVPEEYASVLKATGRAINGDMMLVSVTSLLGWAATGVILIALVLFAVMGLRLCFKQRSGLGFFVSLAIILTFSAQAGAYIVYNLGFMLVTPISLPLMSYNNPAMVINLMLIGLMLSVFRSGDAVRDEASHYDIGTDRLFTWESGKLTVNFNILSDSIKQSITKTLPEKYLSRRKHTE